MKKSLIIILFVSLFFIKSETSASDDSLAKTSISCTLMEEKSGDVLYEKKKDLRLPMASLTKIMTLILIFDNIKSNNIKYEDEITVSAYAASMGGSQVFLQEGEKQTLDTMLKCIAVASANDAAVAVSEHIYGSEDAFVSQMNKKAESLGLVNTHFMDTTGLTTKDHYSSAYDIAYMSKYLLNEHVDVLKYTSIKEDYFRKDTANPFWLVNTNKLVRSIDNVDGLKTGFTTDAMYCISTTMQKDGMRLISVVMGCSSITKRSMETMELLNYGFANFELVKVLNKGDIVKSISDIRYKPYIINLIIEDDKFIVRKKGESTNITYKYNVVNNGGEVLVYSDEQLVTSCNIVGNAKLEKNNFFKILFIIFKKSFT